jgi:hypothetical protein
MVITENSEVGVYVGVGVKVIVGVRVLVGVGVKVEVGVKVGVEVGVGVRVTVEVAVIVGVGVARNANGPCPCCPRLTNTSPIPRIKTRDPMTIPNLIHSKSLFCIFTFPLRLLSSNKSPGALKLPAPVSCLHLSYSNTIPYLIFPSHDFGCSLKAFKREIPRGICSIAFNESITCLG